MTRISRILSVFAVLAVQLPARAEIVDGVAVVVNGDVITLSELEQIRARHPEYLSD